VSPTEPEPPRPRLASWFAHLFVAAVWILAFKLFAEHGVRVLPLALAHRLTLQNYLTLVQIVTALFGLGVSFLLLRDPKDALGFERTSVTRIGLVLLLAPAVYVLASYIAIFSAVGTLLEELARGGRQLAQKSTGQFGQELVTSSLASAIFWGVVISPAGEELLFRGALYSLAQRAIDGISRVVGKADAPPPSTALPPELLTESIGLEATRAFGRFLKAGAGGTLFSASIFTLMHMDMAGGLGIVRWVSALCLGLATGITRYATGGIWGPIALHMAYNFYSLATTRRWIVTESFPIKMGVPTLLSVIAVASALAALAFGLVLRQRARAS